MKNERTLMNLRKSLNGKIYLYFKDTKTCNDFLSAARNEGYSFGDAGLPDSINDNIISLKKNRQLCYVGFVGRIEFQCNGGDFTHGRFHRIDYAKYIRDNEDYYYQYPEK